MLELRPSFSLLAVALCVGCFSEVADSTPGAGTTTGAESGPAGTSGADDTASSSSGIFPGTSSLGTSESSGRESSSDASDSSSSGSDGASSTGDDCERGALGCACDEDGCSEGVCREETCVQPLCGDGWVEGDETCDDGNEVAQDGCEQDCVPSTGVAKVAAGDQHSCALFHDGRLRCWGSNTYGKLGYGNLDSVGDDETPASVGDVDVGADVVDVACGREHTCVIVEGGAVRCWGLNNRGQLGIPGPTYALGDSIGDEPTELPSTLPAVNLGGLAVAISASSWSTFVLLDDGTVRCFGQNANFGTCGYGTDEFAVGDDEHPVIEGPIDLGAPAIQIDAHGDHACALLDDGTVRCWGFNPDGALGLGHLDTVGDDELPSSVPVLSFETPAVEIQTALRHTCVRLESGEVKCWGRNNAGELGLGDVEPRTDADAVPPVSLGGAVVDLAAGGGHGCALLDDGALRCWGDANFGRLGYGNASNDVGDDELPDSQPALALAVGVVHDIDVGNSFSCARVDDGEVMCWGANNAGQIAQPGLDYVGDNETLGALSPIVLED